MKQGTENPSPTTDDSSGEQNDQTSDSSLSDNPFERFSSADIFDSPDKLRDFYTPDDIKHRDEEISKLVSKLGPALENNRPGHALLVGPNGSGKTVVSKWISQKFLEMAGDRDADTVHVNCGSIETEYKMLARIINTITPASEPNVGRGYSVDDLLLKACNEIETLGDTVLLVLDEVGAISDMNKFLYQMTRPKQDGTYLDDTNVAVIFTGNQLEFADNLSGANQSKFDGSEIIFDPYDADELRDILNHRAEEAFTDQGITEGAIHYAAAKAAQRGGDARYGLLMLLEAGEYALALGESPVGDKHVRVGKQRRDEDRVSNLLTQLNTNAQLALVAMLSLRTNGNSKPIGTDIIEEYNRIGSAFGNTKGRNSVYNYLTDLEQVGIITRTDGSSGSVRHNLRYPENAVLKKVDDNLLELLEDAEIVSEYEGEYSISNRQ